MTTLLLSALFASFCSEITLASVDDGFDSSEWDADGWLGAIIGPELLARGDEFGCHGIPRVDPREDHSVFSQCTAYLGMHTEASRWGADPLSFGFESGNLAADDSSAAYDAGFRVIGPGVELEIGSRLTAVTEDGGTLERNIADTDAMQAAIFAAQGGGLVSISWQDRIGDLNVRKDSEAIEWLEAQSVWFTTWGEWWSHSQASRRIAPIDGIEGNQIRFHHPMAIDHSWSTPGTIRVEVIDTGVTIVDVTWSNGTSLPSISIDERHLRVGWRSLDDDAAVITSPPGVNFTIELSDTSASSYANASFNGIETAVSIVGLHTTDLMEWSSGFSNSPMRFTWLVEPGVKEGLDAGLLVLAGVTLVATVATMLHLVQREERANEHDSRLEHAHSGEMLDGPAPPLRGVSVRDQVPADDEE